MPSLLSAGSNSGGQLGIGNLEDAHRLKQCITVDGSSFPPPDSRILKLDSGANHTLALLQVTDPEKPSLERREIWVTGAGSEGQIGISNIREGESSLQAFRKLDLERDLDLRNLLLEGGLLEASDGVDLESIEKKDYEPIEIACGWDSSYVALRLRTCRSSDRNLSRRRSSSHASSSSSTADVGSDSVEETDILISLGTANDFGELGVEPIDQKQPRRTHRTVHLVHLPPDFHQASSAKGPEASTLLSISRRLTPKYRQRISSLEAGPRHVLCLLSLFNPPSPSPALGPKSSQNLSTSDHTIQQVLVGFGAARHGQVGTTPSPAPSPSNSQLPERTPGSRSRPGKSSNSAVAWKPQAIARWELESSSMTEEGNFRGRIAVGRDHSVFLQHAENAVSESVTSTQATLELKSIGSNRLGQCSAFLGRNSHSSASEWMPTQVSCNWNGTSVLCQRSCSSQSGSPELLEQGIWVCGSNAKGQWGVGNLSTQVQGSLTSSFAELSPVLLPSNESQPGQGKGQQKRKKIRSLACGSEHTLILVEREVENLKHSEVWGWGWSEHGNLAQGDEVDQRLPVLIWSGSESDSRGRLRATDIWAGCGTSFIQLKSDRIDDSQRTRGLKTGTSHSAQPTSRPRNGASSHTQSQPSSVSRSPDLTPAQLLFCKQLPKIELHAHLNGSIRRSTLTSLAQAAGLDAESSRIVSGDARTLSEMFSVFDVIHKSVRGYESIKRISREMLEDLEEDGVVYAEIRTTPSEHSECGLKVDDYVKAVLDGFKDYQRAEIEGSRVKTIARLILSIDRKDNPEISFQTVDLALRFRNHGIVGIDLSGDPTKGEWEDWEPALIKARESGLRITLHAGEVNGKERELEKMLKFRPDRFGHLCFTTPSTLSALRDLGTPIELCLTSNLLSNSVPSYAEHHFLLHHHLQDNKSKENKKDRPIGSNPICLGTDDCAVFGSPLSREYAIAMSTFGLDEDEMRRLAEGAVECVFVEDEQVKREIRRRMMRNR